MHSTYWVSNTYAAHNEWVIVSWNPMQFPRLIPLCVSWMPIFTLYGIAHRVKSTKRKKIMPTERDNIFQVTVFLMVKLIWKYRT